MGEGWISRLRSLLVFNITPSLFDCSPAFSRDHNTRFWLASEIANTRVPFWKKFVNKDGGSIFHVDQTVIVDIPRHNFINFYLYYIPLPFLKYIYSFNFCIYFIVTRYCLNSRQFFLADLSWWKPLVDQVSCFLLLKKEIYCNLLVLISKQNLFFVLTCWVLNLRFYFQNWY